MTTRAADLAADRPSGIDVSAMALADAIDPQLHSGVPRGVRVGGRRPMSAAVPVIRPITFVRPRAGNASTAAAYSACASSDEQLRTISSGNRPWMVAPCTLTAESKSPINVAAH